MVSISVCGLSVELGRRVVLNGVDARFEAGRMTGVIGPNGAGKSTLVRAILGLSRLSAGRITLDGCPIAEVAPRDLARTIAYLPQGHVLHWPLSVERVVALGRLPHLAPLSRIDDEHLSAIRDAMTRADVLHLADRDATRLSGGERARVMLARALAVGAPALVADEPLASLDPGHQIDVMDLLRDQAQQGAAVVVVLHDLTMAARYCDDLLLIDQGRAVAQGAPADILTADRLRAVYGVTARIDMTSPHPTIVPIARAMGD